MATVKQIIAEYAIELDDVRWFLAKREAERILQYRDNISDLASLIQRGKLEADWYRMEERYLDELQEKLDKRMVDEAELCKICVEIEKARISRWTV
jgi:hypothetical protein